MARHAFIARAITTCFSESGSMRAGGRSAGMRAATRMRANEGWRSSRRSAVPTVAATSVDVPGLGRAESSRKRTILSHRATSVRMRSRNWRASRRPESPDGLRASDARASAQPAIPASGFETSCATPATSWPRKARRSEAMSRISSARRSVMSSNHERTWVTVRPWRTGRRRTWKSPPEVSVVPSCGTPVLKISFSIGTVSR
jgi:hypothetical protein